MTYTDIQVKGGRNYYYRAKSIRDGSKFKKLRKYMGVGLSKEELEEKEKEMDLLLGESFKGVLRDEGIGKMRQRLIVDVSNINTTENPIKITDFKITQPSLNKVKTISEQYNKAFHSKIFTLMASSESELYTFAKRSPQHYKMCLCFVKEEEGQWYLGTKDLEHVRAWIIKEARKSPQPIFELYNKWERDWQKYLRLEKELRKINLSVLTTKELYKKFKEFYQQYQLVGSIAYICDAFMSYGEKDWLEQLIIEELKKIGKPMPECIKLVRKLTCPVHLSFTLEEEYQLMKIANKFLEKFDNIPSLEIIRNEHLMLYKELKDHEETFYWIQNNYFNVHYMDVDEFYKKIKIMIKDLNKDKLEIMIKEKEKELTAIRKEREQLINELGMSRFTKNILKIARLFSKWKDIRKSGVYVGMYHFDCFLNEVAKRTEFTKKQLTFCIFQEMEDILFEVNHEIIKKNIKERQKQCFFTFTDHG